MGESDIKYFERHTAIRTGMKVHQCYAVHKASSPILLLLLPLLLRLQRGLGSPENTMNWSERDDWHTNWLSAATYRQKLKEWRWVSA